MGLDHVEIQGRLGKLRFRGRIVSIWILWIGKERCSPTPTETRIRILTKRRRRRKNSRLRSQRPRQVDAYPLAHRSIVVVRIDALVCNGWH